MNWPTLLSDQRLGKDKNTQTDKIRSEWQRDYDRIIFSSAFRRLQDKTQVFPLSESDFPRTRLTHSLESASVGRSIGIEVGQYLVDQYNLGISDFDIGSIVASACLAHDIGNPPFGHSGEEAIQDWFKNDGSKFITDLKDKEKLDFEMFEGNAQGFRILASRKPQQNGGMQMTYSTLGAFTKYPRESFNKEANKSITGISSKKHGFFQSEKEIFCGLASKQ